MTAHERRDRASQDCYTCRRTAADDRAPWEQVYVGGGWRLTMAFDSSLPGWLVLVPVRHVEALHELTAEEADGLGPLLRDASVALVEVTGCERTYVMLFAEAHGFAHLHLHIVPRHRDLPTDSRGPGILRYLGAPPEQQVAEVDRNVLAATFEKVIRRERQ